MYRFTEHHLTGDANAAVTVAALDIGIGSIDIFSKVLVEICKHLFPLYVIYTQTHYLCRHVVKYRSMKLCSFVSRLHELNAFLGGFPLDLKGQETDSFPQIKSWKLFIIPCPPRRRIRCLNNYSLMQILPSKK